MSNTQPENGIAPGSNGSWKITESKVKKGGVKDVAPGPRPVVPPQCKTAPKGKEQKN